MLIEAKQHKANMLGKKSKSTVFLVDDHPIVRQGLAELIDYWVHHDLAPESTTHAAAPGN